jgi:hypothetical protein
VKPYRGPPMTLGAAAAAKVRLIVWCKVRVPVDRDHRFRRKVITGSGET